MSCIVHFGLPKTGTSSIQSSLFRLNHPRFHFVDFGTPNASEPLANLFLEDPMAYYHNVQRGLGREAVFEQIGRYKVRLEMELERARDLGKSAIISAEHVSVMSRSEVEKLLNFCGRISGDVKAIGYVRPPRSSMHSQLQQIIKSGRPAPIPPNPPKYRQRIAKFFDILGADNVTLVKFDLATLRDNCAVRDFTHRVGMPDYEGPILRENGSLSRPAVQLLYVFWQHGPRPAPYAGFNRDKNRLITAMRELRGPKFAIHSSLLEPVLASCAKDIRWAEEALGAPLDERVRDEEHAIRGIGDMLEVPVDALQWLGRQLGRDWSKAEAAAMTPTDIGTRVFELMVHLRDAAKAKRVARA